MCRLLRHELRCVVATHAILFDVGAPDVSAPPTERRAHPRLRASELRGLKTARVKYGPQVKVIDLSAGGVLFETTAALPPYSSIVFEFSSQKSTILVPSRLLRYHEVLVGDDVRFAGSP
jgi:PilZ domain